MTIQEIKAAIRETRKEMRAKGIKRTSCFNGGLSGEVYSYSFNWKLIWKRLKILQNKGII